MIYGAEIFGQVVTDSLPILVAAVGKDDEMGVLDNHDDGFRIEVFEVLSNLAKKGSLQDIHLIVPMAHNSRRYISRHNKYQNLQRLYTRSQRRELVDSRCVPELNV